MKFRFLLSVMAIFTASSGAFAQCPASIAASASNIITASCPSNGGFTINANSGTGVSYQITSGPAGFPTGAQSGNVFSSLTAGTYTVKVACAANNSVFTTVNVTIPSSYVQLQATSATANVCTSGTPGGTINTTASAGTPPYQYAYFTGSTNAADNTLTYGSASTYAAPAFGTYNIRVKDACGVFVTQQVTIARTYPANLCITSASTSFGNLTCAQLTDSIYLNFNLNNNATLASLPAAGIDIELYQNTGTCGSPVQGALIKVQHFGQGDAAQIKIPRGNVLLKLKTPCGDSCTFCYAYSGGNLAVTASVTQSGCADAANPNGTLGINANVNTYFVYPVTYTIKNSSGTVVATYTVTSGATAHSFTNNFPYGTYTVTATDACGTASTQTVAPPPTTGAGAQLSATVTTQINSCTSENGKVSMSVVVNGTVPNLSNATVTIIAPSPSHVGVNGVYSNGRQWDWINILPNATYYIKINNNCGRLDTLQITTPAGTGQNQQIITNVTQLCGGTGNIDVTISRLGNNPLSFTLKNSSGTTVGTGTLSGSFANLPADTYRVDAKVNGGCSYTFSKTGIVILPAGSGPSIQKKLGAICEDASGNATGSGSAFIKFIGAAPLKVDYKLTSQSDAQYVNITNASSGTETISGLAANQSYTIRVTDGCGNGTVTQVVIGKLDVLTTENTVNPCAGSPYTLSVPDMVNATYEWKKNGIVISNERSIEFPSYTAASNGQYICTVVIGGCVTRIVNVTLNSTLCGQALPVKLASFNAAAFGKKVLLTWSTSSEQNAAGFRIQRSADAAGWSEAGAVPSQAINGTSSQLLQYSFYDNAPLAGNNFYRLRQLDADGREAFSDVRKVVLEEDDDVSIFPNPANEGIWIVPGAALLNRAVTINIYSFDGRLVKSGKAALLSASQYVNVSGLAAGKYAVRISGSNTVINKTIQIVR